MRATKPPATHTKSGCLFNQIVDAGFIIDNKQGDLNDVKKLSLFNFVRRAGIENNPSVGDKGSDVFSGDITDLAGKAAGGGLLEIAYRADSVARRARDSYTAGVENSRDSAGCCDAAGCDNLG